MRSIFLGNGDTVGQVYRGPEIDALESEFGLRNTVYTKDDLNARDFRDVDFIFSTWGMPSLSAKEISGCFPALKAVFYAAGTVQAFARPFLECGVRVFSAWAANAVPVSEYAVAQIILANKGFFRAFGLKSPGEHRERAGISHEYPGNYGCKVGILGAGMIGKLVIRKLKSDYNLQVLVFDPFLPEEKAKELGAVKTDLHTVFRECTTISNHLANNEQTKGMLNKSCFSLMKDHATFINTGRGAQVVNADLEEALRARPFAAAVLDVTYPEPLPEGHPFYRMENVILTPHMAGSQACETERMARYMVEECRLLHAGRPVRYEVTADMLKTMA